MGAGLFPWLPEPVMLVRLLLMPDSTPDRPPPLPVVLVAPVLLVVAVISVGSARRPSLGGGGGALPAAAAAAAAAAQVGVAHRAQPAVSMAVGNALVSSKYYGACFKLLAGSGFEDKECTPAWLCC
jgi:hypothetical protein